MANSDKNIKITPNTGESASPKIEVTGADNATKTITINDDGTISFDSNISASTLTVASDLIHSGDTNNKIAFDTDTQSFQTGGTARFNISDSGLQIGSGARVTTIITQSDGIGSNDNETTLPTSAAVKDYVDNNAGGSPGGSDGQVQYNNGGSFGGDADFTWDDSNNRLVIGSVTSQHDNLGKLTVKGTDASFLLEKHDDSASGGPSMTLYRYSASEADGDLIGQITFRGEDSAGSPVTYSSIRSQIVDTASSSKDGRLIFRGLQGNTQTDFMKVSQKVQIGPESINPSGVTAGKLTVSRNDTDDSFAPTLLLVDGDADANNGPMVKMYRNTSSPADNDELGSIFFAGEDSAGNERTYASIRAISTDVTSGTNDGELKFQIMSGGSQTTSVELSGTGVKFNGAYTFPTSDGSNGQVLTTNGSGTLSFTTVSGGGGASAIDDLSDALTASTGNLGLGSTALDSLASGGNYNTAVGVNAGTAITTADNNTVVGYEALSSLQTSSNNVAIGYHAARDYTRQHSVFIGSIAGRGATTGNYNTAVGSNSMYNLAEGYENTALGYQAGFNLTGSSARWNTILGKGAGDNITGAQGNTVVGRQAADGLQTGQLNVIIGTSANGDASNGSTVSDTVAIGYQSGYYMTGDDNTFVGHRSGFGVSGASGAANVSIGQNSGDSISSGSDNTTIGSLAGSAISSGSTNICIGHDAGDNITTGSGNVVIGAADVTADENDQLSISSGDGDVTWITGDSSGHVTTGSKITSTSATLSGSSLADGASFTLATVPTTTRGFKATIYIKDTSNTEYQIEEIMGYNTGSGVDFTSFGQVYSGSAAIGSLNATNSSGTTLIQFTNAQGSAINYQASISLTHMALS